MARSAPLNCKYLIEHGASPVADSDVSGIGVILAFEISAYLSLAVVMASYFLGYIDNSLLRPVDRYIHGIKAGQRESLRRTALRKLVLVVSDQQIVTGVAVSIAGFIGLAHKMSVYHFQIVIYLAWMSSSVHLSALTMLSGYLRERRALLWWRIAGMLVLLVLLLVALIPTASYYWAVEVLSIDEADSALTGWAIPARCCWFHEYGSGVNPDAPFSFIILLISYIWKTGALFKTSRRLFHVWIRGGVEYNLERMLKSLAVKLKTKQSWWTTCQYRIVMGVYVQAVAMFEFAASFAASLWLSLLGLVFGTIEIEIPRAQDRQLNAAQEDVWTFGQIVPIVLLIQPLGAVLENCTRKRRASISEFELLNPLTNEPRSRLRATDLATDTLSDFFATSTPAKPSGRTLEIPDYQLRLYESAFFRSIIWWTHVAILGVSITVFVVDAQNIGYVNDQTWFLVLVSIAAFTALTAILTIAAMFTSRIFR